MSGSKSLPESVTHAVSYGYLFGLAGWLFVLTQFADRPWTFFAYYGVLVAVVPILVDRVAGTKLSPARRLYVGLGLAFHPISHYYGIYEAFVWWDVIAHFISASLLAAGLYALLLGLQRGTNHHWLYGRWPHVWAVLFVAFGGVTWEFYETFIDAGLTVYGPWDTLKDMVVNLLAWAVVAAVHHYMLDDVTDGMEKRVYVTRGKVSQRRRAIRRRVRSVKRRIRAVRRRVRRGTRAATRTAWRAITAPFRFGWRALTAPFRFAWSLLAPIRTWVRRRKRRWRYRVQMTYQRIVP